MTVYDLYGTLVEHRWLVPAIAVGIPATIAALAGALRVLGADRASQQVANAGIAVGIAAVLAEVLGLVYAIGVLGVDPIATVPVTLLVAPAWLAAAGSAIEHLLHPDRQESVRRPIRAVVMSAVSVGVLGAVFSVLDIHMLVLTRMAGFLVFVGVMIGLFGLYVRRLV